MARHTMARPGPAGVFIRPSKVFERLIFFPQTRFIFKNLYRKLKKKMQQLELLMCEQTFSG